MIIFFEFNDIKTLESTLSNHEQLCSNSKNRATPKSPPTDDESKIKNIITNAFNNLNKTAEEIKPIHPGRVYRITYFEAKRKVPEYYDKKNICIPGAHRRFPAEKDIQAGMNLEPRIRKVAYVLLSEGEISKLLF